MDEKALFALMRKELFTAVVGDVLDQLGYQQQFLPPQIMPLEKGCVLAGRAMTVLEADVFASRAQTAGPLADKPFGLLFEALDDLREDEIYIATGSSFRYALWGGLMSTRALHLKAAGAVLDGYVRDANEIERLGFSVFSRGTYAQDQGPRGKVIDWRCPIVIENVHIETGDLIFADREGVLVVPRAVESEAIARALEKVRTESDVARAIRNGMSTVEAFATFGVM